MAGSGHFAVVGSDILESAGGIGLLWYTPEEFGDFILKVDWRSSGVFDNSGVFLRFPALGSTDPANDWRLAVDQGYEVQIDARGYNPDTNLKGLELDVTMEDPKVFKQPLTARVTYRRVLTTWTEGVCADNPMEHYKDEWIGLPRAQRPDF